MLSNFVWFSNSFQLFPIVGNCFKVLPYMNKVYHIIIILNCQGQWKVKLWVSCLEFMMEESLCTEDKLTLDSHPEITLMWSFMKQKTDKRITICPTLYSGGVIICWSQSLHIYVKCNLDIYEKATFNFIRALMAEINEVTSLSAIWGFEEKSFDILFVAHNYFEVAFFPFPSLLSEVL